MVYYSSKKVLDFRIFDIADDICSSKITINKADQEQSHLVEYIQNFNNKTRPKNKDNKKTKKKYS